LLQHLFSVLRLTKKTEILIFLQMKKLLLLLLSFLPLVLSAQEAVETFEYPRFRLGVEAGIGMLDGTTVTPAAVRENQSYYYDDHYYRDYYYCGYVNNYQSVPHYYVGVKPEFSVNNSVSFATGLRFVLGNSTLSSDKNYFLWKVAEDNLTTHYVRVKEVKQHSFYVGIPVEMTVYTYNKDLRVRHYFRAGVNFNFLLAAKTTPHFEDEAMNKHADMVANTVKERNCFTPLGFIGTGLKIGRMNRPFGTVEIRMPFVLKGNTSFSSFVKSSIGVEFQTAIYIPMGKKKLICIWD
jgi:hypothetical protein